MQSFESRTMLLRVEKALVMLAEEIDRTQRDMDYAWVDTLDKLKEILYDD